MKQVLRCEVNCPLRTTTVIYFACLSLWLVGLSAGVVGQAGTSGLSNGEFRALAASLPDLPGRIQAVQLFEAPGKPTSAALLTLDERGTWQVFVVTHATGGFQVTWKSGALDDTFHVSSPDELRILYFINGEPGVVFSGCAAHSCGDAKGVFSILLYVPAKKTVFVAKCVLGKVTYSPELELPENQSYKSALQELVKQRS